MLYLDFFSRSLTSHYKIHAFFPSLDCHDAQYKNNLGIQTFIRTLLCEIGVTCHSQQCQQTSACSSDIRSSAVLVALSLCLCPREGSGARRTWNPTPRPRQQLYINKLCAHNGAAGENKPNSHLLQNTTPKIEIIT